MKIEAMIQGIDRDTGRLFWAVIAAEAFDPESGLTDQQVWERYVLPAFKSVQQELLKTRVAPIYDVSVNQQGETVRTRRPTKFEPYR